MGCCATKRSVPSILPKVELPKQEHVIAESEKLIPFSKKTAKDLNTIFKANSNSGRMSVNQLKKALGELELDPQVFTDPDTQVYKFLTRLQNEKKLYDIAKLSLCAILLGDGDTPTKAGILFGHFDADASLKLERGEIQKMLEEMVDLVITKIPLLALRVEGDTEDPAQPKLSQEESDQYTGMLANGKERFIANVMNKLIGASDGITDAEFVKKVSEDAYLGRLVWSTNIRISLYEESKATV